MTIWQAIILGLVQGITEFLPVSSSGHLVVARALLGAEAEPLIFEIVVHCGTLLAVLVVFRHDILRMLKNPFGKLVRYLVVATIPAVIFTLLFDNWIESAFGGRFLGIGFILTAILLTLAERCLLYTSMYLALDDKFIIVQITIICCYTEILSHILAT